MVRPKTPAASGKFNLGVVGGAIGAVLGATLWYFVAVNSLPLRLFAVVPGMAAAGGAILLAGRTSEKLAVTVTTIAAIITIATQFAVISGIKDRVISAATEGAFTERMALAKRAANAKSDDDVRRIMVDDSEARFEGSKPEQIEGGDVEKYRASNLVALQKFAKGEPSRAKFEEKQRAALPDFDLSSFQIIMMIVWIISGISGCYKTIVSRS